MKKRGKKLLDKKSQASIITIVLIILLVLVAIVIVWNIVVPIIKISGQETEEQQKYISVSGTINPKVLPGYTNLAIEINRGSSEGDIKGVKILFEDNNNHIYSYENINFPIKPLESRVINLAPNDLNLADFSDIKSAELYFIYEINGKEKITNALDENNVYLDTTPIPCTDGDTRVCITVSLEPGTQTCIGNIWENCIAIFSFIKFISPTPANNTNSANKFLDINISIELNETFNLSEATFNWNGLNFTIYDDSLILMMNFDNNSNLGEGINNFSADISRYKNSGNCTGMSASCNYTNGRYGLGMSFDGENDYINISDYPSLEGMHELTINFWINARSYKDYDSVVAKGGNTWGSYSMFYSSAVPKRIRFYVENSTGTSPCSNTANTNIMNLNQWYMITGVLNSSGIFSYTNGSLSGSIICSIDYVNPADKSLIIGGADAATEYFNGTIDELKIWNRQLSSLEIKQLYFMSMQKFNSSQWYLYVNQSKNPATDLDLGTYNYQAFAKDRLGNKNLTEKRYINII